MHNEGKLLQLLFNNNNNNDIIIIILVHGASRCWYKLHIYKFELSLFSSGYLHHDAGNHILTRQTIYIKKSLVDILIRSN